VSGLDSNGSASVAGCVRHAAGSPDSVLAGLEGAVFAHLGAQATAAAPAVFILGAPRTGSSYLYQLIVHAWRPPFLDNRCNEVFPATPVLGLLSQLARGASLQVRFESRYGKTTGEDQPSEASAVMRRWFGGGHPSQRVSRTTLPGKLTHLQRTLDAIARLFNCPLLIKNAWNCFRVEHLARELHEAAFIWIRRDIRDAAASDLAARIAVHGDACAWNSATPSNFAALRRLPPWAQVVENQVEFNRAIGGALAMFAPTRHVTVWYEDVRRNPEAELDRIARAVAAFRARLRRPVPASSVREPTSLAGAPEAMRSSIDEYVRQHAQRLAGCLYARAAT